MRRPIRHRQRSLLWKPDAGQEVAEEIAFHLEMRRRDLEARGAVPEEARRAALERFGDRQRISHECLAIARRRDRAMRLRENLEEFVQDLVFALRQLRRQPLFTGVAVLTLSLGLGANTAIFSLINGFIWKPLPVAEPDRLAVLASAWVASQESAETKEGSRLPYGLVSYADYRDLRTGAAGFDDLLAWRARFVSLADGERSERRIVSFVSGNYFSLLGVRPHLGRLFLEGEGQRPGADPWVVLGHGYWQSRYNGDPTIVGRRITIDGAPFTVIGVVPAEFKGLLSVVESNAYLLYSMRSAPGGTGFVDPEEQSRDLRDLNVLGRLADGAGLDEARAALEVVAERLANEYPQTNTGVGFKVFPENLARPGPHAAEIWPPIIGAVFVLVGLVLATAAFNVANLLAARFAERRQEIAIRAALGAGHGRLTRQLLTESLLLSFLGGFGGLAAALVVNRALGAMSVPGEVPIDVDIAFDGRVYVYLLAAVLATAIVMGLWPAWHAARSGIAGRLNHGRRSAIRQKWRGVLIAAQVAVSVLLLVAAGLFLRSLGAAESIDLGFDPENILTVSFDVTAAGFDDAGHGFYRELERRAAGLPGVRRAATAFSSPLGYRALLTPVAAESAAEKRDGPPLMAGYNAVGRDFFALLDIELIAGRGLRESDDIDAPKVAIVNQRLAEILWPGEDPLGRRFEAGDDLSAEVVGVARDGKYEFFFEKPKPYFYLPLEQKPLAERVLLLETTVEPTALIDEVRRLAHQLEPTAAPFNAMSLEAALGGGNGFFLPRMAASFAGGLGVLGLILALGGIYGVAAFLTSRRTREIGIRLALGAERRSVVLLILKQGFLAVLWGLGVGLIMAFLMSRGLAALLFGINPGDPPTFIGVALLLALSALGACWLPARRAARVDPTRALRSE